ncbi:hypothetical protein [Calothrix sp. PCC 7507]|uniref:hypothetical protein n=1 Tax=Calothrix sp. PCC 7507 TaxID=99598 RepID=UPI00029EDA1C|nr:hypothetical protein [Calothrix sp. PCC 7507]AFY34177.1 hypothetical protein Cal7507_3788 [Calothrix sp. PCC 7507]
MTQPNILELAKQGDTTAINTLVNEWLNLPSITAKTTLKQDCLQIMLESQEVPEQQSLVPLIHNGLISLNIESIKKVKIYGRETGEDFPDWQQELAIELPSNSPALISHTENEIESSTAITETTVDSQLSVQQPSFFGSFFGAVGGAAVGVGGAIGGALGAVGGAAVQAGQGVAGAAVGVGGTIGGALGAVGGAAVQAGQGVAGAAVGVGGTIGGALGAVGGAAVQAGQGVAGAAVGVGGVIGDVAFQATQIAGQALTIVGKNPALQLAIKSLNQDWLNPLIQQVDIVKAETAVKKLQQEHPNAKPGEIAHHLMLEKAVFAGGTGLASSLLPGQAAAMFAVDWAATSALSVELVYQIAAAYGLDLKNSERKAEIVAIFGLGVGGKTAIRAGLGLLRNAPIMGAVIGASSNAVMIYALGYAACQFYEAKQNPLTLQATLVDAQLESEKYLEAAISQEKIMDQILVHVVLAGNPDKSWAEILPDLQAANLSPSSIEAIASQITSPTSLEKLLEQVNSDFAVPLLAQCHKIANLDGVVTPEEAQVIATIKRKLNRDLAAIK